MFIDIARGDGVTISNDRVRNSERLQKAKIERKVFFASRIMESNVHIRQGLSFSLLRQGYPYGKCSGFGCTFHEQHPVCEKQVSDIDGRGEFIFNLLEFSLEERSTRKNSRSVCFLLEAVYMLEPIGAGRQEVRRVGHNEYLSRLAV